MNRDLLATQLLIPPPVRGAIPRPGLVEVLERGVPDARLVVIAAPAGYGKTTLLAQWARRSTLPIAWISVADADNDPTRFLRCLLGAWDAVRPGLRKQPAGLLLGDPEPETMAVLAALVREAEAAGAPLAFVIDDAHLLTDSAVHRALEFLLDHLPPGHHLVLSGREALPLSLARRRARNELLELHADDLRFNLPEARAFLRDRMGLDLADNDVDWLQGQLEGWPAGWQLAGLTLRHHPDLSAISGRHRHIADYLADDVFGRLPEHIQAFLLETSILDRLTHALCAAVTGNDRSQQMLEDLERANLFLIPLDDHRTWFRYHRLFADFLRHALSRRYEFEEVLDLHAQAARWYLDNDLPEEAFRHALEGDDVDTAARVIDRYLLRMLFGGEFRVLAEWIAALPDAWLASRPELALAEAQTLLRQGQPDACARRLGDVERLAKAIHAESATPSLARATAMRCILACHANDLDGALSYASRALQVLPEDDYAYRSNIYHALGESYREHRRWSDAYDHYLKALALLQNRSLDPGPRLLVIHIYGALADLELRQGRMQKAAGFWQRAQAAIEDERQWGQIWLPIGGWVYLRIGELRYEWNDLDQARTYATRGLERATLGGDPQAMIAGNVILARLELADGNHDAAALHLDRARAILDTSSFNDWAGRFDRCQVDFWIATGAVAEAIQWVKDTLAGVDSWQREATEPTLLAVARVLIHRGAPDGCAQAVTLLNQMIATAAERGETGVRIEALALRAVLRDRQGDQAGMLTDLEQSLREAEPEGYMRLFVDLGPPMARLLQEARDRKVMPGFVGRLLAAFGDPGEPGSRPTPIVEPLSERELDVLRLIAAGLSNREIAGALFVSPETVKKHTGNIYGKLGVHGRMEAVARARSFSLID